MIMKIVTPFSVLRHVVADMYRMHHFSYEIPNDKRKDFWEKECEAHPTALTCKIYED